MPALNLRFHLAFIHAWEVHSLATNVHSWDCGARATRGWNMGGGCKFELFYGQCPVCCRAVVRVCVRIFIQHYTTAQTDMHTHTPTNTQMCAFYGLILLITFLSAYMVQLEILFQ